MNRRWLLGFGVWLLCSLTLAFALHVGAGLRLASQIGPPLTEYLRGAFDESFFSSAENRVNDGRALARVGAQVNSAVRGFVNERWYAPRRDCVVQLLQLDGVQLIEEPPVESLSLTLSRNGIDREVLLGISCEANLPVLIGISALLGGLFLAIGVLVPAPLSAAHRRLINKLLDLGYSGDEAFGIVSAYSESALQLGKCQLLLMDQLHEPATRNMADVMQWITHAGVSRLDEDQAPWFVLGHQLYAGDAAAALAFAEHPDGIQVDLPNRELRVRGHRVPTSATPLFYYAWYALKRVNGDGWVTNPPSNRPDRNEGRELAQFMASYDAHAKAVRDLEESGLKARTLDQNRSKIKDELVAELGEELAPAYLFQARKHADGVQMSYRLALDSACVTILG